MKATHFTKRKKTKTKQNEGMMSNIEHTTDLYCACIQKLKAVSAFWGVNNIKKNDMNKNSLTINRKAVLISQVIGLQTATHTHT